jgi:hypothetical protein
MIKTIKTIIKVEDFIQDLKDQNLINDEEKEYEFLVKNMCNNAAAFMYGKILDNVPVNEIKFFNCHNGYYKNTQHSWVSYNNKVLDLTLKQFNNEVPDFYIGSLPKEFTIRETVNFYNYKDMISLLKKI